VKRIAKHLGYGAAELSVHDNTMTAVAQQDFLDPILIADQFEPRIHAALKQLRVAAQLPSTNQALLDSPIAPGELWICLAEHQTAGRGRRGRQWLAPAGSGLCLSLGFGFAEPPADLAALTLASGVVAAELLRDIGAAGVQLKWPNDLVWQDRKLGGLLTELVSSGSGPVVVVVGLGLNLDLPAEGLALDVSQRTPPVDLASIAAPVITPSVLAGRFANALGLALLDFDHTGFTPFQARFAALDVLADRSVEVSLANGSLQGIAKGITADGRLRVNSSAGETTVLAGDVTLLRPNL
jgi:BirA family biotin operon repressor/biotin-[acetyl-CoA-carboxylase] ligase